MKLQPAVAELFGQLDFDPDELHSKYMAERDRRLRPEGAGQYIKAKAGFAHYLDDPWAVPFVRDAVTDSVDVAIVGGGFGGLMAGARLREVGLEKIRIVEVAGDVGGTWYWNRYPGAMCDVESYCYLPLLEETGYIPERKYSFGPEIFEQARRIARHYDLYQHALLQTSVTGLKWDEASNHWQVATNRGDRFVAKFIVLANGVFGKPKLPGILGIDTFKGHSFHTSRWDFSYTGGNEYGGLVGLKDKRVGIIGTGATAIQCIPHLAEGARHLYVFQRTPSSIDVRNNRETSPEFIASLQPGWQKRRMENFNNILNGVEEEEDLVSDGWTDIYRNLTGLAARAAARQLGRKLTKEEREQFLEVADYRKMNSIRKRAEVIVKDPATANALKPWYRQFCKRPCFHDEYLQTFNRPNVTLVDTKGRGVGRMISDAAIVDGKEYPIDCLVFASGFEVGASYTERTGYDIVGAEGVALSNHWKEGLRTLHGLTSHNFPNCFFVGRTQTGLPVNLPLALEHQTRHVAYIVDEMGKRGATRVEPTAEAEADYVGEIVRLSRVNEDFYRECTPGYYNSEGAEGNSKGFFSEGYGGGPARFFQLLERWREEGALAGLTLS